MHTSGLAIIDLELGQPDIIHRPLAARLARQKECGAAAPLTIGRTVVGELLHKQQFSLQANRKTREGHPDRDAHVHTNGSVKAALAAGQPVISVDTKKKELVGDFKNAGQAWRPRAGRCRMASTASRPTRAGSASA